MAAGISTVHRHCFFLKVCVDALSYAIWERHPEILVFAPLSVYVCCYTANVVTVKLQVLHCVIIFTVKTTGLTQCVFSLQKLQVLPCVCLAPIKTTGFTLCCICREFVCMLLHCYYFHCKDYSFHTVFYFHHRKCRFQLLPIHCLRYRFKLCVVCCSYLMSLRRWGDSLSLFTLQTFSLQATCFHCICFLLCFHCTFH